MVLVDTLDDVALTPVALFGGRSSAHGHFNLGALLRRATAFEDVTSSSTTSVSNASHPSSSEVSPDAASSVSAASSGGSPAASTSAATKTVDPQEHINEDVAAFEDGMSKLETASNQQLALGAQLDKTWTDGSKKLEQICLKLRDSLERLAEGRPACEHAQTDSQLGIPYLFTAKARDPGRFDSFGKIRGCAAEEGLDGIGAAPSERECVCGDGTEELGCQDAKDTNDHELGCSRILNKTIKDLDPLSAFQPGGICRLESTGKLMKPLLPPSSMPKIRQASIFPSAFAVFLPPPRLIVDENKCANCSESQSTAALQPRQRARRSYYVGFLCSPQSSANLAGPTTEIVDTSLVAVDRVDTRRVTRC